MTDEETIFGDIYALCEDADELGLTDVALVLEFALDVFLKETGATKAPPATDAVGILEPSAKKLAVRKVYAPHQMPNVGWSMSRFPLADMKRKAS